MHAKAAKAIHELIGNECNTGKTVKVMLQRIIFIGNHRQ